MNFDNVDFNGYSLSDDYIEDHCDDYTDEDVLDYFDDGDDDEF